MTLGYLDMAAQDPNPDVFLMALADVAKATVQGDKAACRDLEAYRGHLEGEERLAQT